MVLEVVGLGGRQLASEPGEMQRTVIVFMVLEVDGEEGEAGFRIVKNRSDCHYFHGVGGEREGAQLA